jgi:hypothetical protein
MREQLSVELRLTAEQAFKPISLQLKFCPSTGKEKKRKEKKRKEKKRGGFFYEGANPAVRCNQILVVHN